MNASDEPLTHREVAYNFVVHMCTSFTPLFRNYDQYPGTVPLETLESKTTTDSSVFRYNTGNPDGY